MENSRFEDRGMGAGRGQGGGRGAGKGAGNGRGGSGEGCGGRGRGEGSGRGAGNGGGRGATAEGEREPGAPGGMLSRVLQVVTGNTPVAGLCFGNEPRQGGWIRHPGPATSQTAAIPSREPFPIPVVIPERCTGCGVCQQVCGPEVIKLVGELAVIDETECISCEACVQNCPEQAIRMPQ